MYFVAFAETLERDASVGGSRRHVAVQLLLREYRNLQAALQWTLDARDPTVGLRLARTLQLIWKEHGLLGEGLGWIHALLELPGAEAPTPARAVALLTAASASARLGDKSAADRLYAEAYPLAHQLGDPWILFVALVDQGDAARQVGDYVAARTFWAEGLEVTRSSGDHVSEGLLLMNLGRLAIFEGNYGDGRVACNRALELGEAWAMSGSKGSRWLHLRSPRLRSRISLRPAPWRRNACAWRTQARHMSRRTR